jgi:hypothetical protein
MILTGRTPRLREDNHLQALTAETDGGEDVEAATAQFLKKVELIASIHGDVLLNVEHAQKQQKKSYVAKRGKHLFEGLIAGLTMVKMKKPGKRRALIDSSGILTARATLILRRGVECASFKMAMVANGNDLVEISKFSMLHRTEAS